MSKTDKTAPFYVKACYYPSWVEEHHDHRNGICELPKYPCIDNLDDWGNVSGTCCWTPSREFLNSRLARCACKMCQGYDGGYGPRGRRTKRREGKRYAQRGWRDEY